MLLFGSRSFLNMPTIVFLATAWGPKAGGINTFNMDMARALAKVVGPRSRVVCVVPRSAANSEDSPESRVSTDAGVKIIHLGLENDETFDPGWAGTTWVRLQEAGIDSVDWWIGHDVVSGEAANRARDETKQGNAAAIMHMSYRDYQFFKHASAQKAQKKHEKQRKVFERADRVLAVGPLLWKRASELADDVQMLIPGLPEIPAARSPRDRIAAISFGRLDPENDRIKQVSLAVAGFAEACRRARETAGGSVLLRGNDASLKLLGVSETEDEMKLMRLAQERAGRVISIYPLPYEEDRTKLLRHVAESNLALMLSWHEGFGLTGWEAIAAEVPLITSSTSGLFEFLSDEGLQHGVHPISIDGALPNTDADDDVPFTAADQERVATRILDLSVGLDVHRKAAQELKKSLIAKGYTWPEAARTLLKALELRPAADTRESQAEASWISASVSAFTAPSSLQTAAVEAHPLSVDVSVSRNSTGPLEDADSGLESLPAADHGAQLNKSEVATKVDLEPVPSTPRAEVVPLIYAVTLTAASQYRSVRKSERSTFCDSLKQHKIAWLVAEWGMGKYEFLHACLGGINAEQTPVPVIRVDCVELAERGFLAKPESCIDVLVQEARLLALHLEDAAVVLDDVPYDRSSSVGGASIHDRVEILAQRLVERFGGSRVVLLSRYTPARACLPVVRLDALGEEECQTYVEAHASGGKDIVSLEHIERLYEMSEGVPMYLDWILKQLKVVSIGELVDSIDSDAFAALVDIEPIPRSLGHAVDGLLNSADRYTRRSLKLLKMLTVLSRGETLRVAQDIDVHAVKHIDRREPFFPDNVTQLCALGLLRAKPIMDVETSFQDPRRSATADSQKNLIVPKSIRDYVSNHLLTADERRDIAQTALDRLLGDGWRCGAPALGRIARIPGRSALGVQIGPGNPFVVLMWLLGDAVKRGAEASSKNLLVVIEAFISALREVDRFRDVHLICGEVVRFLDSVNRADDAARISFDYGHGLRMLGHHQEAIWALERATRYNVEGVSNQWKSRARLGLAMAYVSVKNHLAAKDYAREAMQLAGAESAVGYQARGILVKLDDSLSDADRREKLKYLWQRASKRKFSTVANNLALDLADEAEDARARADFRKSVISTNDPYNVLRAKLSDAEELIKARKTNEISMEDRRYFQSAYSYLYYQRMGNLFERCTDVLWTLEHHRTPFLQMLLRISTPLLRLLGKDKKEEHYRADLVRLLPGGASDRPKDK